MHIAWKFRSNREDTVEAWKPFRTTWAALTSSTRGSTAGSGNRETVFFITASLRVWKIFCEEGGKKSQLCWAGDNLKKSSACLIEKCIFKVVQIPCNSHSN